MFQIVIALLIILFFISRIYWQRKRNKISKNEFIFWLIFWLLSAVFIIFIKKIDDLVAGLGFTASGIDVLSYLSIPIIFYLIFKIFVKMEKIEKNITDIIRNISINNEK